MALTLACGETGQPPVNDDGDARSPDAAVDVAPSPDLSRPDQRGPIDAGIDTRPAEVCAPACKPSLACGADATCGKDVAWMMRTRDAVDLDTRVFLPDGEGPWPTILLRTPYLAAGFHDQVFVPLRDLGYAVVFQSCRGTGESGGVLDPLRQEFADGEDAVAWVRRQPWSNKRVGTIGASYEGFTALAAAVGPSPIEVVIAGGSIGDAFEGWPLRNGISYYSGLLWWLEQLVGVELVDDPSYIGMMTNLRPLADLDVKVLGQQHPVWRNAVPHMDKDSKYWRDRSILGKLNKLCAPGLHFQASMEWADDPWRVFDEARSSACPEVRQHQRFVLTPYGHAEAIYTPMAKTKTGELLRAYLETYLAAKPGDLSAEPAARFFVSGDDAWHEVKSWPAAQTYQAWHLSAPITAGGTGGLTAQVGPAQSVQYSLAPDNDDPCALDFDGSVYFASAPLAAPLKIVGGPRVVLHLSATTVDADVFVWLGTLDGAGQFETLHTGRMGLRYRKDNGAPADLVPGEVYEVTVKLPSVARSAPAGHSIFLSVSAAECGAAENPHTGEPAITATSAVKSQTTLVLGAGHPSRLLLPVVE